MKRCSKCQYPNPDRLTECYQCGTELEIKSEAIAIDRSQKGQKLLLMTKYFVLSVPFIALWSLSILLRTVRSGWKKLCLLMQRNVECPFCCCKVNRAARKCKHCGEWLEDTERESAKTTTISKSQYPNLVEMPIVASPPQAPAPATSAQQTQCPFSKEDVPATAKKCSHCGEWLEDADHESIGPNTVAITVMWSLTIAELILNVCRLPSVLKWALILTLDLPALIIAIVLVSSKNKADKGNGWAKIMLEVIGFILGIWAYTFYWS